MTKTVEIFKQVKDQEEVVILETTSTSTTTDSSPYKETKTEIRTEEFPTIDALALSNRSIRFWSGAGIVFGSGLGVAVALKVAEQAIVYATGNYHGNSLTDAGVDLAAAIGAAATFESSRRGWTRTSLVSARLKELTSRGLATAIPRRG